MAPFVVVNPPFAAVIWGQPESVTGQELEGLQVLFDNLTEQVLRFQNRVGTTYGRGMLPNPSLAYLCLGLRRDLLLHAPMIPWCGWEQAALGQT